MVALQLQYCKHAPSRQQLCELDSSRQGHHMCLMPGQTKHIQIHAARLHARKHCHHGVWLLLHVVAVQLERLQQRPVHQAL